jgi:cytochrome c
MKQLLPAALLWLSASTVLAAPNAQALATSKNCLACHAVDRKLVGPSYQDVAARYAGQKDAVSRLAEKIQKGARAAGAPCPCPPTRSRRKRPRPWPAGCCLTRSESAP